MDAALQEQHDLARVDRAWATAVIASGFTIVLAAWLQHFGGLRSGAVFYADSLLVLAAGCILARTRSRVAAIFLLLNLSLTLLSAAYGGAWFFMVAGLPFGAVYLGGCRATFRLHRHATTRTALGRSALPGRRTSGWTRVRGFADRFRHRRRTCPSSTGTATRVVLRGEAIVDWASFHSECKRALGFPAFYGNNMNAWIDCMSSLRVDDGMVGVALGREEVLELEIRGSHDLARRLPDVMQALVECTAFANRERYVIAGEPPAIVLVHT
jgi:hypothetical protein